ncbi:MAG: AAA domain-containing protein, partial [Proteobacteria bacterium]|nr:AAA domain-containing protein [Pseudomonadota bacterium]
AASTIFNREILVKEVQCKAQGHEYCVYEGRTAAEWDDGDPVGEKPISLLSINEYLKVVRDNHERFQAELKKRAVGREKRRTKQGEDGADEGIISRNEKITKFLLMAKKVAPTDTTVLIQGESGTGKEVMARYIHRYSGRLDEPFMAINCAALPANLLESELFGHVKGAFTGADSHKQGLLVKAGGGTILLDEVGELPLNLQPKLLRVIQQKEVRPVGGVESIPVNARLIAATNSDLKEMMTEGGFRNDLYYRLAVFPISLCPLRERQEDIVLLARHFVSKSNSDHPGISPEALRLLNAYSWPGNIRELENCIEFALIMADDKLILPDHLPGFILQNREDSLESLSRDLPTQKELEKRYTQMVLKHTNHNKKEAARILDISIPTLWRRLKE